MSMTTTVITKAVIKLAIAERMLFFKCLSQSNNVVNYGL